MVPAVAFKSTLEVFFLFCARHSPGPQVAAMEARVREQEALNAELRAALTPNVRPLTFGVNALAWKAPAY